jgi:hypothetical protein
LREFLSGPLLLLLLLVVLVVVRVLGVESKQAGGDSNDVEQVSGMWSRVVRAEGSFLKKLYC